MDREEADGADGVEAVCEWLATEAGLCEEEMHEARPLLLRERVYTVHRLELLRQEGCLREVFGARNAQTRGQQDMSWKWHSNFCSNQQFRVLSFAKR